MLRMKIVAGAIFEESGSEKNPTWTSSVGPPFISLKRYLFSFSVSKFEQLCVECFSAPAAQYCHRLLGNEVKQS